MDLDQALKELSSRDDKIKNLENELKIAQESLSKSKENLESKDKEILARNQKIDELRQTNLDLYLKVGSQFNSTTTEEEEQEPIDESLNITLDDLFN